MFEAGGASQSCVRGCVGSLRVRVNNTILRFEKSGTFFRALVVEMVHVVVLLLVIAFVFCMCVVHRREHMQTVRPHVRPSIHVSTFATMALHFFFFFSFMSYMLLWPTDLMRYILFSDVPAHEGG